MGEAATAPRESSSSYAPSRPPIPWLACLSCLLFRPLTKKKSPFACGSRLLVKILFQGRTGWLPVRLCVSNAVFDLFGALFRSGDLTEQN